MKCRRLGRTGLQVSEIGFGAWGVGGALWGESDDNASRAALARALELGINFLDTALVYGRGHSEQLIGDLLRHRPHQVYIATKIPPQNMKWPANPGVPIRKVFPFRHVRKCVEESLRNLKRSEIDLIQFHVWNDEWSDRDEWKKTVQWLKSSGKARFVGISINDHEPRSVLTTLKTGLIDCVQVIYNIFDPSPTEDLFPLCEKLDVGVIARVPLDEGGLTGSITVETDFASSDMRSKYFRGDRKAELARRVDAIRADIGDGEPIAQTALRFCLSDHRVSTTIPGMRRTVHVEANVATASLGSLSAQAQEVLKRHKWQRNFYH